MNQENQNKSFVLVKTYSLVDYVYKLIKNKGIAPGWFIYLLDVFICIVSIIYANLLRFNFDLEAIENHPIGIQLISIILVNSIFFYIFKTYRGIIRMSSIKEGKRCITAISYSVLVLFLINVLFSFLKLPHPVPTSILIIYFFTSSFIIFSYRVLAKDLYHRSIKVQYKIEHVLIFGGTSSGSLLKKAIEDVETKRYQVVAFLDNNPEFIGKSIENVKIYSFEQFKKLGADWNIQILFLADDEINLELKNEIVDYCFNKDIQVKIIPPVQKWVAGQLHTNQIKNIKIEDLLNRPPIQLATDHVQNYLRPKKILITGAAGSIGSEIARQVASMAPASLLLCDNSETGLYQLEYELKNAYGLEKSIEIIIGDVTEEERMRWLFNQYHPDIIFHAAAYKHVPMMEKHPAEAVKNNVLGTKIIADLAKEFSSEKFVFISTDKAINPTSVMGASKRLAEIYIKALHNSNDHLVVNFKGDFLPINDEHPKHTKFITTRFGNVLGSNGSVIPRFKEQIEKGGPVTVTDPEIIRYFMTIPEACSLVLEACTMGNGGEIFLFDMGEPVKIADLANKMIKLSGLIPGKDIKIEFTGLRAGEKLYEEVLNKEEELIPTHHKKIMIYKTSQSEFKVIQTEVQNLIELSIQNEKYEIVKKMKMIIPEYKSNNSEYESIDKEMIKKVI